MNKKITEYLGAHWMSQPGAYVLVDGQYGSTGKGVIACALAECYGRSANWCLTNAGPNSGHTFYLGDDKYVLKQLPTFGVVAKRLGMDNVKIMLTGGAIIDPDIFNKELYIHGIIYPMVHPAAAVITEAAKKADEDTVLRIASTGQGIGPAMANKILRNPNATVGKSLGLEPGSSWPKPKPTDVTFIEVSQGFSLGINSGFYPHTTSRECTVSQALADAGLPPTYFRKSVMSVRTFPIRVGNTENSSGPHYPDQEEITWESLGVEPEWTTVTKRIRRIFTWSKHQFMDAVFANAPEVIFLNFMNYLAPVQCQKTDRFVQENVVTPYVKVMGHNPKILLGFGPKSSDIELYRWS